MSKAAIPTGTLQNGTSLLLNKFTEVIPTIKQTTKPGAASMGLFPVVEEDAFFQICEVFFPA